MNLHLIPISFLVHNDLQNFKKETCAVQKLRSLFEYIGNFKIKFRIIKHVFVNNPISDSRNNRQSLLFAFVVQFLLWVFYVILWTFFVLLLLQEQRKHHTIHFLFLIGLKPIVGSYRVLVCTSRRLESASPGTLSQDIDGNITVTSFIVLLKGVVQKFAIYVQLKWWIFQYPLPN